ncbi:MAG: PAS domain S-box protein [Desulfuromonadaceae bacterium]|nr:PAS domain S-box protein [Desulfuromonadaceae bacterium]MDD2855083.1 PAS domain S-box protein [Desulfuromonadaceae bacterium]
MHKLLEQFVENISDAILVSDKEGIIRFWNSGAELIFGFTATEAIGRSLDLIIPEPLRKRHWEGFRRVMATGETKYKTSLLSSPGISKSGSRISLEFSMLLLHDENGELAGCASIMRNVNERFIKDKELRERLTVCEKELASHRSS